MCPEERFSKELNVPEFCDWKIENGYFKIKVPKLDLFDGDTVYFDYCVHGETGRMTLHVRNVEIDVERFGLSRHVTLDQVWIDSVIHLTDVIKLCKGYMDHSEYLSIQKVTTNAAVVHQWNSLLGTEVDAVLRVHDHNCEVVKKITSTGKTCRLCANGIGQACNRSKAAGEVIQNITYVPPKTKKKRKLKRKTNHSHQDSECDCLKRKKTRKARDSMKSNEPQIQTSGDSTGDMLDTVTPKVEVSEFSTSTTSSNMNPTVTSILSVKKEFDADISESGAFDGKPADISVADSKSFNADMKGEIQDESMVFLPQRSIPESQLESSEEKLATRINTPKLPIKQASSVIGQLFQTNALCEEKKSECRKIHECTNCGLTFKNIVEAEIHRVRYHYVEEEPTVNILDTCPLCGMTNVEAETHYRKKHDISDASSLEAQLLIVSVNSGKLPFSQDGNEVTILPRCALCNMTNVEAETHYSTKHNIVGLSSMVVQPDSKAPLKLNRSHLPEMENKISKTSVMEKGTPVTTAVTNGLNTILTPTQQKEVVVKFVSQQNPKGGKVQETVEQRGPVILRSILQPTKTHVTDILSTMDSKRQMPHKLTTQEMQNVTKNAVANLAPPTVQKSHIVVQTVSQLGAPTMKTIKTVHSNTYAEYHSENSTFYPALTKQVNHNVYFCIRSFEELLRLGTPLHDQMRGCD